MRAVFVAVLTVCFGSVAVDAYVDEPPNREDVRQRGFSARQLMVPKHRNPYDGGEAAEWWLDGWTIADTRARATNTLRFFNDEIERTGNWDLIP